MKKSTPTTAAEAFAQHAAESASRQPSSSQDPKSKPAPRKTVVNSGAFVKGISKVPGSGRKKGTPNKATRQAREIFADLLQDQIDKNHIAQALDAVFLENPKDYLASVFKLAQFNMPALQSVELKNDPDAVNPFVAHMTAMVQLSQDIDKKNKASDK